MNTGTAVVSSNKIDHHLYSTSLDVNNFNGKTRVNMTYRLNIYQVVIVEEIQIILYFRRSIHMSG